MNGIASTVIASPPAMVSGVGLVAYRSEKYPSHADDLRAVHDGLPHHVVRRVDERSEGGTPDGCPWELQAHE